MSSTSRRRLRILAGIGAVAFGAGALIAQLTWFFLNKGASSTLVMTGLCLILCLMSAGVWIFASRTRASERTTIRVGLGYVIAATVVMSVGEVLLRSSDSAGYDGVPGLCIWIVLFPLIIPCKPSEALVTALIAASTLPLVYFLAVQMGKAPLGEGTLWDWILPGFFCAALAWGGAASINKLTMALQAAREQIKELGSYELQSKLGEGGMGEVWRAKHRLLPREAAIKLIKSGQIQEADPANMQNLTEAFEREAKAISLLRSPHTVELYDFGLNDEGDIYYTMELLDGLDLETLVQTYGPQGPSRAIHLLIQICRSLGEAHGMGLVHRDIKPGNIMCCQLGTERDFVKVLDFGLVGAVQEAAALLSANMPEERLSSIAGTPGYIAPEHLLGPSKQDPRADLYALGAVGYFLLTGRTLYPTHDGGEDLVAHTMDPVPDPRLTAPYAIPNPLANIIMKCCAKTAIQRPENAQEVETLLMELRHQYPWTPQDAADWWAGIQKAPT